MGQSDPYTGRELEGIEAAVDQARDELEASAARPAFCTAEGGWNAWAVWAMDPALWRAACELEDPTSWEGPSPTFVASGVENVTAGAEAAGRAAAAAPGALGELALAALDTKAAQVAVGVTVAGALVAAFVWWRR